jgi:hypothetical protein
MRLLDGRHSTASRRFLPATRDDCQLDDPSGWLIVLLTI